MADGCDSVRRLHCTVLGEESSVDRILASFFLAFFPFPFLFLLFPVQLLHWTPYVVMSNACDSCFSQHRAAFDPLEHVYHRFNSS